MTKEKLDFTELYIKNTLSYRCNQITYAVKEYTIKKEDPLDYAISIWNPTFPTVLGLSTILEFTSIFSGMVHLDNDKITLRLY